jgi:hypothetical protein
MNASANASANVSANRLITSDSGPGAQTRATAPRRSWFGSLMRGLFIMALVLSLLTFLLTVLVSLWAPLAWDGLRDGVNLTVNGEHFDLGALGVLPALAIGAAVALTVCVVCAVVFTVVPLTIMVVAGALIFAVGSVLLSALGVAAVALSPLLLVVGIVWLLVRRKPGAA